MAYDGNHGLSNLHHFGGTDDNQPPQQITGSTSAAGASGPNWLNTALLHNQHPYTSAADNNNFLNLHTAAASSGSPTTSSHWLPRQHQISFLQRNHSDVIDDVATESFFGSSSSEFKVRSE